jgi:hypothetical protein
MYSDLRQIRKRGFRIDLTGNRLIHQDIPVLTVVTVLHTVQEVEYQSDEEPDDKQLVRQGIEVSDQENAAPLQRRGTTGTRGHLKGLWSDGCW